MVLRAKLRIRVDGGVVVELGGLRLAFDPARPVRADIILVSHGHTDHSRGVVRSLGRVVATRPTLDVIKRRYGAVPRDPVALEAGEAVEVGGVEVEAVDAGHIIGSAQFIVTHRDLRIGFTGDINLEPHLTEKPGFMEGVDVLIMEATYGSPYYVFPDRWDIYSGALYWARERLAQGVVPVMIGYSLGKAQELTALASRYMGLRTFVSRDVARYNEVEDAYRHDLGRYEVLSPRDIQSLAGEEAVVVASAQSYRALRGVFRRLGLPHEAAYFTGWALSRLRFDGRGFPLSSHADYSHLMSYVERVGPKEVYVVYGFKERFAREVRRRLGLSAKAL